MPGMTQQTKESHQIFVNMMLYDQRHLDDKYRTGCGIGIITAIMLPLIVLISLGIVLVAREAIHSLGIGMIVGTAHAQTRPVPGFTDPDHRLPWCDDISGNHLQACLLVSEEKWGGGKARVVYQCTKGPSNPVPIITECYPQ